MKNFAFFCTKTCLVGTHLICPGVLITLSNHPYNIKKVSEVILLITNKICFGAE